MTANYETYHETLSGCVCELERYVAASNATFADENWREEFAVDWCLRRETTGKADFELSTLKGKPTKKWAHASIYRLDSGRYELTIYFL